MLNLQNITYATTFLATSASLNFITNIAKNSLPEIDTKTLEATSPYLADFVSYASVAGSWAIFGLTIYAAHSTGMTAISTVTTAVDIASGAYELAHNPEIINMVIAGASGYLPNTAALVSGITGIVNYSLESLSTYNMANMVSIGAIGLNLEDLVSITNLANFCLESLGSMTNIESLFSVVDIASTGMIGVSASDLINNLDTATSLFSSALDY